MRGEYKVPGGKLVTVSFEVENNRLVNVQVAGDFFLQPDAALGRINAALQGRSVTDNVAQLARAIKSGLEDEDELLGFDEHAVAIAVRRALGYAMTWDDVEFELIHTPVLPPVVNMALDQVLPEQVAQGKRKCFMRIWEWDSPLLVMGSFQSYDNEVDPEGCARHGITVSRRITGGGTMFMEAGNCITYSMVVPTSLVEGMSFEASYAYLDQWVMEALTKVGIKARYVPLNDIASEVGKIGGAAQKRFATGYTLHHVTMAYDIDATKMLECMRIGREKLRDKGTASANKRVDPMRSQTGMAREDIIRVFMDHFAQKYHAELSALTEAEIAAARELVDSKFLTHEWIHRIA